MNVLTRPALAICSSVEQSIYTTPRDPIVLIAHGSAPRSGGDITPEMWAAKSRTEAADNVASLG
jgi:hypothetical protein